MVLIVLAAVLAVTFAGRSAPLSRLRGVQRRQAFDPRLLGAALAVGAAGAWLIARYGAAVATGVSDAVGLHGYPDTVTGVLFGAAFTAVFGVFQRVAR